MQSMKPLPDLHLPKGVQRDRLVHAAGVYIVLWLTLWYSAKLLDVLGGASLWFLPAGLRFFSFILLGWPALALELTAVLAANLLQFMTSGLPAPSLLSAQMCWLVYDWCALPIAYGAVLLPLRRQMGGQLDLVRPAHSLLFASAALATSALGAVVGTLHLVFAGIIARSEGAHALGSWLIGDFIGIVTLTPLLLVRGWPRLRHFLEDGRWHGFERSVTSSAHRRQDLHTTLAAALALLLVFGIPRYFQWTQPFPLFALLLLLPLVATALRYGLRGVVLSVFLLDSGLVLAIALLQHQALALQYQVVMIAIASVGLWLGGAVESRNRLMADHTEELVNEVARRTLALQQANGELVIKEMRLNVLLAAAPVGVMELDHQGCCSYLNKNGSTLTGCSYEQALGRNVLDFVHPDDRDRVETAWNCQVQSTTVELIEFRLNANNLWCAAYWINLPQTDSSLGSTVMALTDSTVHHQQEEKLWALAHHDALTELPNRKLFLDRCAQTLSLAKRRENSAAVLWIDLDGFKIVNDTLGHATGDAVLQQVAQRLKARIRDSDTLARMGGDEFAVLMPDIQDCASVVQVANELVVTLNNLFELPMGNAHVSGSIGIALFPQHADSVETLMKCADIAMYGAKHAGKNQVKVWGSNLPAERPCGVLA